MEAVSTQIAQLDTTLRTSEEELQQRIKSVKFEAQEESKLRGNNNEIENNIGNKNFTYRVRLTFYFGVLVIRRIRF